MADSSAVELAMDSKMQKGTLAMSKRKTQQCPNEIP